MLNLRIISKIFGSLLYLEAMLMLCCMLIGLCYHGQDMAAFLWSILITIGTGVVFRLFGRKANNNLGRRDAYFVVTVIWILYSFLAHCLFFSRVPTCLSPMLSLKR